MTSVNLDELRLRRRAWTAAAPRTLYDLIADVSAMAQWSPNNRAAWYDPGHGPEVGAWFTGRNTDGHREWESRAQVVTAEPGVAFAWHVGPEGDGIVRWHYGFHASNGGTVVTETWTLLRTDPVIGDTCDELLRLREHTADAMEDTLIALAGAVAAGAAE